MNMFNALLKYKPKNKLGHAPHPTSIGKSLILPSLLLLLICLSSSATFAHPMGNFSINHYSKIQSGENALELKYIIDMAEISTFEERMDMDKNGDKDISSEEQSAYLSRKVEELKKG